MRKIEKKYNYGFLWKKVVLIIFIIGIISVNSLTVFAKDDIDEDSNYLSLPIEENIFLGLKGSRSFNILTKTTDLSINMSWGEQNLSVKFFEKDSNKTIFFGDFTCCLDITLNVKNNTWYKFSVENPGNSDTTLNINIDDEPKPMQMDPVEGSVEIVKIIVFGIIVISCIYVIYRFRVLVSKEKRSYNRTLEKLIKLYKVNPDKVLDIIREMVNSASMEGLRLVDSLSVITDKFSKDIDKKS